MPDLRWERYEQRKAAWIAANPGATSEQYEQAAIREFRGDQSRRDSSTERKAGFPARPSHAYLIAGLGK